MIERRLLVAALRAAAVGAVLLCTGCQRRAAMPPGGPAATAAATRPVDGAVVALADPPMRFARVSPRAHGFDRPDYFLLETEVTNAVFARYVASTGAAKGDDEVLAAIEAKEERRRRTGFYTSSTADPSYRVENRSLVWVDNRPPPGKESLPVGMVNPKQASAFCAWLTSKYPELGTFRLPTKTEWLIAAYGRDRAFPWGAGADESRYHRSPFHTFDERFNHRVRALDAEIEAELKGLPKPPERPVEPQPSPEPVTARPAGRTPEGLFGMWGNVSELVIPDERAENRFTIGLGATWMGGGFDDVRYEPRQDYWGYTHNADVRSESIGFRVLLDPTPAGRAYQQELGPDAQPGQHLRTPGRMAATVAVAARRTQVSRCPANTRYACRKSTWRRLNCECLGPGGSPMKKSYNYVLKFLHIFAGVNYTTSTLHIARRDILARVETYRQLRLIQDVTPNLTED